MENVPNSNAISSVMYLMACTRPDIAYAASCLSRYMSNAGPPHWEALKWLLRYLSGSTNTCIKFSKSSKGVNLVPPRRIGNDDSFDPVLGSGS
ncbi:UNVERIFIED_CONTAM: Retrovirus-related Pol polyprotein from transposon TNT 1-94 [Sesamum radiatum]|uniref:Retrovirus-related Pol polyprotein from transposon TNT 1-94 n=1 Tax=Sesamum radiatum TaxID=300843 RepID=A0AAW2RET3_SESRA